MASPATVLRLPGGVEAGAAAPDIGGYSGGAAERAWPGSGRGRWCRGCCGMRWSSVVDGMAGMPSCCSRSFAVGLNSGRKLAWTSVSADDGGALGRRSLS